MMSVLFMRIFFLVISTFVGYQLGTLLQPLGPHWVWIGAGGGLLGSSLIVGLEFLMRNVSVRGLSAAVFGLLFGLLMAKLVTGAFLVIPLGENVQLTLQLILTLIFCYFGMAIAIRGRDEFNLIIPYIKFTRQDQRDNIILLDTSVIIDGRIADICQTKFIEGRFVVPKFVLKELQQIADSSDSLKRNRGRRGLDVLNRIRRNSE